MSVPYSDPRLSAQHGVKRAQGLTSSCVRDITKSAVSPMEKDTTGMPWRRLSLLSSLSCTDCRGSVQSAPPCSHTSLPASWPALCVHAFAALAARVRQAPLPVCPARPVRAHFGGSCCPWARPALCVHTFAALTARARQAPLPVCQARLHCHASLDHSLPLSHGLGRPGENRATQ